MMSTSQSLEAVNLPEWLKGLANVFFKKYIYLFIWLS